jgi:1-acyl-sn-glycerol-3-phosphate acyltransferase
MSIPDLHEALPSAPPEAPRGAWRDALQVLFFLVVIRPFMALFIGLRVRGREYLPDPGRAPFVLIANHASHLDTISLLSLFPLAALGRIRPVAAADYFTRTPLMTWLSRTFINILPIERRKEDRTHDPLEVIRTALDRGESLILFPEGTRAVGAEMGRFKAGIAIIATDRPKIPIVPAWLGNMGRSLPKGEFIPVPFFCDVRLGSPLHPTGTREEILAVLESAVRGLGKT